MPLRLRIIEPPSQRANGFTFHNKFDFVETKRSAPLTTAHSLVKCLVKDKRVIVVVMERIFFFI
jgi:hypothetical protein